MSASRPFLAGWVLGLTLLISLGLFGWTYRDRQRAEAAMAAMTKVQHGLDASIQQTQARLDRDTQGAVALKAKVDAQAKTQAAVKAARPDFAKILSAHPELLAVFVKATRGYLSQQYGALFERLHLSPDRIDHLESLIIDNLESNMDLQATARAQGLANNDPVIVKEREQQTADLEAAEQTVLDPAEYTAFSAVSRAQPVRGSVEQLAAMTMFSANPLTGDQSTLLTQVMAEASSDYRSGKNASSGTIDWDAVLAQAPNLLAPSQIAALRGIAQLNRATALTKAFAAETAAPK